LVRESTSIEHAAVLRGTWIALASAGCVYRAGSYQDVYYLEPWSGARVELACLEVAIDRVHDAVAPDPVISIGFGNRCDHRVVVDLGAVRVTADGSGEELVLVPHDPNHELVPRALSARWSGSERIAYEPSGAGRVCVDVSALERDAHGRDAIRCFDPITEAQP
jgi:hypothetical protein